MTVDLCIYMSSSNVETEDVKSAETVNLLSKPQPVSISCSNCSYFSLMVAHHWHVCTFHFPLKLTGTGHKNWWVLINLGDPNVSHPISVSQPHVELPAAFFSNKLRMLCREECLVAEELAGEIIVVDTLPPIIMVQ